MNEYYTNGQLKEEIILKDGIEEITGYCENGQINFHGFTKNEKEDKGERVKYYKNKLRHGKWVWYHDNGKKSFYGNYKNGEEDGIWYFYDEQGNLEQKKIHDGHGVSFIECKYYKNGQLKSHGVFTRFSQTMFRLDGKYETYYNNGDLKSSQHYSNFKKNSIWSYNDNKKPKGTKREFYLNDILIKTLKCFYHNEELIKIGYDSGLSGNEPNSPYNYKIYSGECIYYNRDGSIQKEEKYNNGELIEK